MQSALTLIGSAVGLALATGIIYLWRLLRRHCLLPTAVIGYVVLAYAIYNIVILTSAYLAMRNDSLADMGPFWGLLALAIGLAVVFCALTALVQAAHSSLRWWKLFGCMVAEAGFAIGAGMLLNECQSLIADMIGHGSHDIPQILRSIDQSRTVLSTCYNVLFWTLLLWEFGSPFFRKLSNLPTKERRSPVELSLTFPE